MFYGRAATNLDAMRALGDKMPGTSGDAIEQQLFGQVRPDVESRRTYRRYPVVAVKMPLAMKREARRLAAACAPVHDFWRATIASEAAMTAEQARAALKGATQHFADVMRPHMLSALLCQALYQQLHRLAEQGAKPGLELRLATGYGDMAETALVADLWAVSRDQLSLAQFLDRHGYHGPREGELSSRVWRIDPAPLTPLVDAYRTMEEDRDPRAIERARETERGRAEQELLDALPAHHRPARSW